MHHFWKIWDFLTYRPSEMLWDVTLGIGRWVTRLFKDEDARNVRVWAGLIAFWVLLLTVAGWIWLFVL